MWEKAECKDQPEMFFPIGDTSFESKEMARQAKEICARCPLREECLEYALDTKQHYGIWGGMTEQERGRLHRGLELKAS